MPNDIQSIAKILTAAIAHLLICGCSTMGTHRHVTISATHHTGVAREVEFAVLKKVLSARSKNLTLPVLVALITTAEDSGEFLTNLRRVDFGPHLRFEAVESVQKRFPSGRLSSGDREFSTCFSVGTITMIEDNSASAYIQDGAGMPI